MTPELIARLQAWLDETNADLVISRQCGYFTVTARNGRHRYEVVVEKELDDAMEQFLEEVIRA